MKYGYSKSGLIFVKRYHAHLEFLICRLTVWENQMKSVYEKSYYLDDSSYNYRYLISYKIIFTLGEKLRLINMLPDRCIDSRVFFFNTIYLKGKKNITGKFSVNKQKFEKLCLNGSCITKYNQYFNKFAEVSNYYTEGKKKQDIDYQETPYDITFTPELLDSGITFMSNSKGSIESFIFYTKDCEDALRDLLTFLGQFELHPDENGYICE